MNTIDFVRQMFPYFSAKQTDKAATYYIALNTTRLPTASDQAAAIMGESIFTCPTFYLLEAFNDKSWKAEFAVPSGLSRGRPAVLFSLVNSCHYW
ncbi:hypothetical protein PILCRDRAFT_816503 [Piloderma croceum F 1598]|uniref:Uncharacterized protein n=1 Tax=Piloderma croceum (strain F 1598) TaxID=765440 RepID=A0A0C3G5K8_PILCF|nr:hypothetical protein PILCRDRAFT_816503 [Piloderma croceum F 1598]